MTLKPQDILLLLKLLARGKSSWTFNSLALELNMSPSEVHGAAKRVQASKLAIEDKDQVRPNVRNLLEFLQHGIQYVFVPDLGGLIRGLPTVHAAPPMNKVFQDEELPPVWPDPEGEVRGLSFAPLYKSVPTAVKRDPMLYELLVLVDAIRAGRAREKNWAIKELNKRFARYDKS